MPPPVLTVEDAIGTSLRSPLSVVHQLALGLTDDSIATLAESTAGQSDNPMWFKHRIGRITLSNMK